jgi:hypothetical protein
VDQVATKQKVATYARALGTAEKNFQYEFELSKRFSKLVKLIVRAERESVCTRKVVGTRIIEAEPARVIPATPQKIEDIIEWECKSILK